MPSGGDSTGVAVARELSDSSSQEVAIISQFTKKLDDQFVIQNEYNRKLLELIEDIKDEANDGGGGGAFGLIGDAVGVALTAGLGAWGLKLWNKIRGKSPEDAAKVAGDAEKKVTDDIKKRAAPTVRKYRESWTTWRQCIPCNAPVSTRSNRCNCCRWYLSSRSIRRTQCGVLPKFVKIVRVPYSIEPKK